MMRFFILTLICTATMFGSFTFIFYTKNTAADSWTNYGWPLTFLKVFSGNDFYIDNHYFFAGNLMLNVLFCFCISLLAMLVVYSIRYFKRPKQLIAE